MKLFGLIVAVVLLGSFCAQAQNNAWKPRPKDEFDTLVEKINNSKPGERVTEEEPEKEVEKAPEPQEDTKPETKPESKPEAKTYKNLKSTPAKYPDGKPAKFQDVVVFSCENIGKKRFLFNKKQSDFCLIKDVKVAAKIAEKIGTEPFKKKFATFVACAETANAQKACDPKQVRSF